MQDVGKSLGEIFRSIQTSVETRCDIHFQLGTFISLSFPTKLSSNKIVFGFGETLFVERSRGHEPFMFVETL